MPDDGRATLTDATRAQTRADEILDLCRSVFAERGFDGASMQDLARAAGMSAGNFYRYFASKDAIIAAMVARKTEEIAAQFAGILDADRPRAKFLETLTARLSDPAIGQDGALWTQIEAAAGRWPAVSDALYRMQDVMQGSLVALFARLSDLPRTEAAARFGAHAELILMMVRGAHSCACEHDRQPHAGLRALLLRTVDHLLTEISPR